MGVLGVDQRRGQWQADVEDPDVGQAEAAHAPGRAVLAQRPGAAVGAVLVGEHHAAAEVRWTRSGPEGGLSWLLAGCALVCIGFSCGFGVAMGEALDVCGDQVASASALLCIMQIGLSGLFIWGMGHLGMPALWMLILALLLALLGVPQLVLAVNKIDLVDFDRDRFREVEAELQKVSEGGIDVIVGTHRLLQTGVRWKDLGLVDGELPVMHGAQALGCSPVAQAFAEARRLTRRHMALLAKGMEL